MPLQAAVSNETRLNALLVPLDGGTENRHQQSPECQHTEEMEQKTPPKDGVRPRHKVECADLSGEHFGEDPPVKSVDQGNDQKRQSRQQKHKDEEGEQLPPRAPKEHVLVKPEHDLAPYFPHCCSPNADDSGEKSSPFQALP